MNPLALRWSVCMDYVGRFVVSSEKKIICQSSMEDCKRGPSLGANDLCLRMVATGRQLLARNLGVCLKVLLASEKEHAPCSTPSKMHSYVSLRIEISPITKFARLYFSVDPPRPC